MLDWCIADRVAGAAASVCDQRLWHAKGTIGAEMNGFRQVVVAALLALAALLAVSSGGPLWLVIVVAVSGGALALSLVIGWILNRQRAQPTQPPVGTRLAIASRLLKEALELREAYQRSAEASPERERTRELGAARYAIEKWFEVARGKYGAAFPELRDSTDNTAPTLRRLDALIEWLAEETGEIVVPDEQARSRDDTPAPQVST